jgi:hypothetical protein
MKILRITFLLLLLVLFTASSAQAQTYLFRESDLHVNLFINQDGTASIDYVFTFVNDPSASAIDYVDVGMPVNSYSLNDVTADVNGSPVSVSSDYQGSGGIGFSVALGGRAIPPGGSGSVHVLVPNVGPWLRFDDSDKSYTSFVFSTTYFGSKYVEGATNAVVSIHLPPGVQPGEGRWHAAPSGFPAQPQTTLDDQGRVTYTWANPQASGSEAYQFGASFPAKYVPASAISRPSLWEVLGISQSTAFTFLCCGGIFALIIGGSWWANSSAKKRKLQYLPPKISIEGMGIKRGLTAVEAAILMEETLDKVMTMILFGVLKKNAATVVSKDPLKLEVVKPAPDGLNPYEADFLTAFDNTSAADRRKLLQTMTINLVNSVSNKMKGFSRKETIAYYKDINERAWKQVEAAQTPEVKSETYDKYLEWTMLDKDYEGRTRDVFHSGPVFVPIWWGRYDPTFSHAGGSARPVSAPSTSGSGGGGLSMPTVPGSAFAASIAGSVQHFAGGVIGNVTDFTNTITNKTNPLPVVTSSGSSWSGGGGGGHSCACACACAGCACACAGGGR